MSLNRWKPDFKWTSIQYTNTKNWIDRKKCLPYSFFFSFRKLNQQFDQFVQKLCKILGCSFVVNHNSIQDFQFQFGMYRKKKLHSVLKTQLKTVSYQIFGRG